MSEPLGSAGPAKSLPLILARELAANLATAMFLLDARGSLVYYNDAAALLIGKPYNDLGEMAAAEFHEHMQTSSVDGTRLHPRDTPSGVAFFERRPAHRELLATGYQGRQFALQATAYPLFGAEGEMHGVVSVFWEISPNEAGA